MEAVEPVRCPVCDAVLGSKPYATWPPPVGMVLKIPYGEQLGDPSYEVCGRCGYEFGNDDDPGTASGSTFEEYRAEWEADGRPKFDQE